MPSSVHKILVGNRHQHGTIGQQSLFENVECNENSVPSIGRQRFIKFEAYTLKKTFRFAIAKMREIVDCLYNRSCTESGLVQLCTWLKDCYDPKRPIKFPFTIVSLRQCIRINPLFICMQRHMVIRCIIGDRRSPRHKMILYQYLVGLTAQDINEIDTDGLFFQVFIILLGIQCERILLWGIL